MPPEGFKETEIGLIPEDWELVKLEELVNIKHGFAFKGEYFSDEETSNILLTPGNFKIVGGFSKAKFKYYDGEIPKDYVLNEGDVIVSMTDLSKEGDTLGYSAKIPTIEGKTLLHNQRLGLVLLKSKTISSDFIYWKLRNRDYRHWVLASASGTTVKHTSPSRILSFEFALPPLTEQKKIASFLSAIDEKIELNQEMNRTLEAIGQAIFRHWFVHYEFPDENGQPYKSSGGKMVNSELGEIPAGWEVGTLADLCELNANSWTAKTMPSEIYYVDLANTKNGIISDTQIFTDEDAPSRARRILLPGDTIFGTVRPGNLSFTLIGDGNPQLTGSTGFAVLTPKDSTLREIVYLITTSEENISRLTHLADGAAYPAVRPNVVTDEICFLPSKMVVDSFHKFAGPLFDLIMSNQKENINLSQIRDSILPKLMSGKIRVNISEEATAK